MSQIQVGGLNSIGAIDQWMKVIASNVTGTTVNGYKGQSVEFGTVLEMVTKGSTKATTGYGSTNAISNSDSGIQVKSTPTDWQQGTITATGNAANMAIAGDGFFAVSKVPEPRSMADVSFTRDGNFHWEFLKADVNDPATGLPVQGVGTFRLVNSDGLFVQGYNSPVIPNVRPFKTPPEESQGTNLSNLSTVTLPDAPGQPSHQVPLSGIQLDLARNPNATDKITVDASGLVYVNGVAPKDLANNDANMNVAVVKFANRDGLDRSSGGAYFKYDVTAGEMFAGVAGTGNTPDGRRIVGSTNVINPGALENSNTSINTVMPEMTLAQKTFSATTKVISIGNSMIDDVNQLVK